MVTRISLFRDFNQHLVKKLILPLLLLPLAFSFTLGDLNSLLVGLPKSLNGANVSIALISYGFNKTYYDQLAEEYNLSTQGIYYYTCPGADGKDFRNWGTYSVAIIKKLAPNSTIYVYDCANQNFLVNVSSLPTNLDSYDLVGVLPNDNSLFDDCSDDYCRFFQKYFTFAPTGFALKGLSGEYTKTITIYVDKAKYGQPVALYNASIVLLTTDPDAQMFVSGIDFDTCCKRVISPSGKEYAIECNLQTFYPDEQCYYDAYADRITVTILSGGWWKLKIYEWQSPTLSDVLYLLEGDYNHTIQSPCLARVCVSLLDGDSLYKDAARGPTLLGYTPTISAQSYFDGNFSPAFGVATAIGIGALIYQMYTEMGLDPQKIDWKLFTVDLGNKNLYGYGKLVFDYNKFLDYNQVNLYADKCYSDYCPITVDVNSTFAPLKICYKDQCFNVSNGKNTIILKDLPVAEEETTLTFNVYKGNFLLEQKNLTVYVEGAPFYIKSVSVYPQSIKLGQNVSIVINGYGKDVDVYINGLYITKITELNGIYNITYYPETSWLNVTLSHEGYKKTFTLYVNIYRPTSQQITINANSTGKLLIGNESFTKELIREGKLFLAVPSGTCSGYGISGNEFCDGKTKYCLVPVVSDDFRGFNDTLPLVFVYNNYPQLVFVNISSSPKISTNFTLPFEVANYDYNFATKNLTIYCGNFKLSLKYYFEPAKVNLTFHRENASITLLSNYNLTANLYVNRYFVGSYNLTAGKPKSVVVQAYLIKGRNLAEVVYPNGKNELVFYYYPIKVNAFIKDKTLYINSSHKVNATIYLNGHFVANTTLTPEYKTFDVRQYLVNGENVIVVNYFDREEYFVYDSITKETRYLGVSYKVDLAPSIEIKAFTEKPLYGLFNFFPANLPKFTVRKINNTLLINSLVPIYSEIYLDSKLVYKGIVGTNPIKVNPTNQSKELVIKNSYFVEKYSLVNNTIKRTRFQLTKEYNYYWGVIKDVQFVRDYVPSNLLDSFGLIGKYYYDYGKEYVPKFYCYSHGKGKATEVKCNLTTLKIIARPSDRVKVVGGWLYIPAGNKTIAFRKVNGIFVLTACNEYCVSFRKNLTNYVEPFFYVTTKYDSAFYSLHGVNIRRMNKTFLVDVNNDYKPDIQIENNECKRVGNYYYCDYNGTLAIAIESGKYSFGVEPRDNRTILYVNDKEIRSIPLPIVAISTLGLELNGRKLDYVRELLTQPSLLKIYTTTLPIERTYYPLNYNNPISFITVRNNSLVLRENKPMPIEVVSSNYTFLIQGSAKIKTTNPTVISFLFNPKKMIRAYLLPNETLVISVPEPQAVSISINGKVVNYLTISNSYSLYLGNELANENLIEIKGKNQSVLIYYNRQNKKELVYWLPSRYYSPIYAKLVNNSLYISSSIPIIIKLNGSKILTYRWTEVGNNFTLPYVSIKVKNGEVIKQYNSSLLVDWVLSNKIYALKRYNLTAHEFSITFNDGTKISFSNSTINVTGADVVIINNNIYYGNVTKKLVGVNEVAVYKNNRLIFYSVLYNSNEWYTLAEKNNKRESIPNRNEEQYNIAPTSQQQNPLAIQLLLLLIALTLVLIAWKKRKRKERYPQVYYKI